MARNYAKVLDLSTWAECDSSAFWANVDKTSECWLWRASGTERTGYGVFLFAQAWRKAHRVSFALAGGALDTELVLDHKCGRRNCVNPAHLEQVTLAENSRRAKSKEYCKRGHRLAETRGPVTSPWCRACQKQRDLTRCAKFPEWAAKDWYRSKARSPKFATSPERAAAEFAFSMAGVKFPAVKQVA